MILKDFYKGKKVLVTGNTGFKGSWMQRVLENMGAVVVGIGLETKGTLFSILEHETRNKNYYVDVRDYDAVKKIFLNEKPEIVIHMAAQPLVIESYKDPVYTYSVNVMGTVNVCESIKECNSVKSFVNVTTDKVYQNNEWIYPYRENDILDGYDPYSNSKSCSELVTKCYSRSFFKERNIIASTCRAGNVIGGGDFADNRIVPDCVRAAVRGEKIIVRNPNSIRPYQHVLEAVMFYLNLAMLQYFDESIAGDYNIGPGENDTLTTGDLCNIFCRQWEDGASWESTNYNGPHEANYLRLDTSKAKVRIGWKPKWDVNTAIKKTVEWYKAYYNKLNMLEISDNQILDYLNG